MNLTAAELTQMRADIETLLPDSVVLQTVSNTPDGQGGVTASWSASGTVYCRLDRRSGEETSAGGAIRPYSEWVLTMPYGSSANVGMRAIHGGLAYNITEINTDKSWPDCVRATVELVS